VRLGGRSKGLSSTSDVSIKQLVGNASPAFKSSGLLEFVAGTIVLERVHEKSGVAATCVVNIRVLMF